MEPSWGAPLWRQLGAAIDMLDNALVACPDALWRQRLWSPPADASPPPGFAEFWYVAHHTLFWLDVYLSASREDDSAPPAPFARAEIDATGEPRVRPNRPYTKEELRAYLAYARRKCHTTLATLTDERAGQPYEFPWEKGRPISGLELQVYNLRHVQEHAAQLSLFLGQHGVPDEALDWVMWAQSDRDSHYAHEERWKP
jgi:hypothetical protein